MKTDGLSEYAWDMDEDRTETMLYTLGIKASPSKLNKLGFLASLARLGPVNSGVLFECIKFCDSVHRNQPIPLGVVLTIYNHSFYPNSNNQAQEFIKILVNLNKIELLEYNKVIYVKLKK